LPLHHDRRGRAAALLAVLVVAVLAALPASARSPLLGVWALNGGEPKPSYLQTFTILRLTFRGDGKVDMRYYDNPPPFLQMMSRKRQMEALAPRARTMTYMDRGDTVELTMGSDLVTFKYELRDDGKLLLLHMPASAGGAAKIYRRVK
jgi:hypothetical protein